MSKLTEYFTSGEFNYLVVFYKDEDDASMVHHMVGVHDEPNDEFLGHLIEELRTDPEFGLGETIYEMSMTVLGPNDDIYDLISQVEDNEDEIIVNRHKPDIVH